MAMTLCGIPVLDQRSCRVDIATTLGEPVEWTIDFGEDVSGWTFSAGLINLDGSPADVDPPNPPEPLVLDVSAAAAGIVTLSITGLATTEEPLGPGHWTWWLAAAVPPATEPSYLLGGDLGIYRVSSFNPSCASSNEVIEVSVGPPTINADVSLFLPGADASGFVQKSGDTMTGDLVLDGTTPYIELVKNNATPDTGRWRMIAANAGSDGAWYLQLRADGGGNLGNAIIAKADGTLSLNTSSATLGTPVVEVPAISGSGQAAQVSAYDATTGQLAIGGIEMGDTGRRNVASLLSNGWTADEVVIRRSGNTVMLVLDTFAPGSGVDVLTLPNGFRPGPNGARGVSGDVGSEFQPAPTLGSQAVVSGGGVLRHQPIAPANAWQLTMTWLTDDAWPVSLPGSTAA